MISIQDYLNLEGGRCFLIPPPSFSLYALKISIFHYEEGIYLAF